MGKVWGIDGLICERMDATKTLRGLVFCHEKF